MRRRLDLAAALVARPTVLFLDEPTTGLDPQSRNDLWEVIEQLVGGGTTVLLTTQYLEEADRLASTLAVLDHGHVIAEGTPAELKADLGATVLEVGLASIEDAGRTATCSTRSGPTPPWLNGTVVEVTVDDGPKAAMAGLRVARPAGITPHAFTLREPSLDDVFLALTGRRTEDETDETGDPIGSGGAGRTHAPRGHAHRHRRARHDHRRRPRRPSRAPHSDSMASRSAGRSRTP